MEQFFPFHRQLKYERERRGWSQAYLAEQVQVDFKTIHRWESGKNLPRPYHRRIFCALFEKSAEELGLVAEMSNSVEYQNVQNAEDWGGAPIENENFYGRIEELVSLTKWINDDHCRIIAILGIGGIGKTTLSATIAGQLKHKFDYVFWRSLQNVLPFEQFLDRCFRCVSQQRPQSLPDNGNDQLLLLMQYFRDFRCLIILDNMESIMEEGKHAGQYLTGSEQYGMLVHTFGTVQHQSCLLITSREKPKEVAVLEGQDSPVRSLHLSGIGCADSKMILKGKGLSGTDEHWTTLVDTYTGNPLALKLISEAIREIFNGNIERFLHEEEIIFGDIADLIGQQFNRLSALEKEILYWLAIEREAVSLEILYGDITHPTLKSDILSALDSLRRRYFIENTGNVHFTLQPVIMKYVTNNLIRRACEEFTLDESTVWTSYAFYKSQSKEYLRESQKRLILAPIAQHLLNTFGKKEIQNRIHAMLQFQRTRYPLRRYYIASNALKLLLHIGYDLQGTIFSHLAILQAELQNVKLAGVDFSHTYFASSTFTSTFGSVLSTALSLQDNLLAIGTANGELWVYQALSGTPLMNYQGHTDGIWSVAFHPHEQILASSSDDGTIRLWDVDTGQCLRIIDKHTDRIRSVTFSPNGQILASGSDDGTIRLWNVDTGKHTRIIQGHTERVWSVAFHPHGQILATGGTDGTVRLWDVETGNCLSILQGHTNSVRDAVFSSDGSMLLSCSDDRTVRLWDVNGRKNIRVFSGHTNRVWSVTFSVDDAIAISGSEDQNVYLWDVHSGLCLQSLSGHTSGIRTVSVSIDGTLLVSGGDDQAVRIWNLKTRDCLKTLQGYTNRTWSNAYGKNGSVLVSSSENQKIQIWNIAESRVIKTLQAEDHRAKHATFSPDGTIIASGGEDQTVRVWATSTGQCLAILRGHTNWISSVCFDTTGRRLASGSEDQTVRIWDYKIAQCLTVLSGHTSWVRSVAFNHDSTLLASGSDDKTIRLWQVSSGNCIHIFTGHSGRIRSISFSPDSKMIASASEDSTVRVWSVETGHCIHILSGHTSWVRSVAFSPHPSRSVLASGGEDHIICLWDLSALDSMKTLCGHTNRIRSITFDPTGETIASCGDDGTIKFWNTYTTRCTQTLITERPYENMNISSASGLTDAQRISLRSLGAFEIF